MSQGKSDPKSRYMSDTRCATCAGRERYHKTRGCVQCTKRRAAAHSAKIRKSATAAVTDPMEGLL
jgi:hypothetical protein